MNIDEARRAAEGIDGWLSAAEATALYTLAKRCTGRGAIVEIGSWKGKSTIWLAAGSLAGSRAPIHAIDPHIGSPEHQTDHDGVETLDTFLENIARAGVSDHVEPIVKTSEEAANDFDEPVELVFIDGAHELEMVLQDFNLWVPKLVDGGFVALHDTVAWDGPRRVAIDRVFKSPKFRDARFADSLVFAQLCSQASRRERLANYKNLLLKLMYERSRKLPLPLSVLRMGKRVMTRLSR